jgi:hypothetical protein
MSTSIWATAGAHRCRQHVHATGGEGSRSVSAAGALGLRVLPTTARQMLPRLLRPARHCGGY